LSEAKPIAYEFAVEMMGFASLNPSYKLDRPRARTMTAE
jgi:hypothetical protein